MMDALAALNPSIPTPRKEDLPPPLLRRLVFGDLEQINAIREIEEQDARRERGEERFFSVDVEISFSETVNIWATCEEEAEEMVSERLQSYLDKADVHISASEKKDRT